MRPPMPPLTRDHLDALAEAVGDALDEGDERWAWELTRALEEAAGSADNSPQPPGPVIGRRFAQAHRRLLELMDATPGTVRGKPSAMRALSAAGEETA